MSAGAELVRLRWGGESFSVDADLLARYDVPGPRYTSYPTAPEWGDDVGGADLEEALRSPPEGARPLSLYVHVPFCERLCLYCGCNVVIGRSRAPAAAYLRSLDAEVGRAAACLDAGRAVRQLHLGGGTPTFLSPAGLEELFDSIRRRFRFQRDAELGVEIDPRVTTAEHIETFRRLGFNRLSIGVQDFDPVVQRAVRRIQPPETVRELLAHARGLGYRSINFDLIYGLPHQTVESFSRTLDTVIDMAPDRIAAYGYAHVPWLRKQQGALVRALPPPAERLRLFAAGLERLGAAGYRFIGFDHFAKPADDLCRAQDAGTLTRNFQGFTTCGGTDLVGFGTSAISGVGRLYAQNARDLASYSARVANGAFATVRGIRLTDDDAIRREVILRLLCNGRLDTDAIGRELGIDFDRYFADEIVDLRGLERDGLVRIAPGMLAVTPIGRIFLRVVGMVFDARLRRRPPEERRYSRTV